MQVEIKFPQSKTFIENLILQRTGPFIKYGGMHALNLWFATGQKAQLFDFLSKNNLINSYLTETLSDMDAEANSLINAIPKTCFQHVVSVGPGNGLLELILFKKTQFAKILIIDIEESEVHQNGFAEKGSGYASLQATKEFLISNGVPSDTVLTCNPRRESLPVFGFDLLISILSMGFHYPCDDYVKFIRSNINLNGRVIFDKRRGIADPSCENLMKELYIENSCLLRKVIEFFWPACICSLICFGNCSEIN